MNSAYTQWQQNGSWTITENINFTVWDAVVGGAEIADVSSVDLGNPPPDPSIINYYIQNDGNVAVRVTGVVSFISGSATVTWNPAPGYVDVPVGTTRQQITLTLTDFSVGSGEFVVAFTSAQAP